MPDGARQLVLDLPVQARFGADDFLVSPSNEDAYGLLDGWPNWPEPVVLLRGPKGSGKSHLASIWADRAGAITTSAASVDPADVPTLAAGPALLVEDLDRGERDDSALFHLVNIARERGTSILLTSTADLERCDIGNLDLLSRLRRAPSPSLGNPDDALLRAVLVKLFLDRQIVVDTSVVEFIATRMERSLGRAVKIVAELDAEALSRGRRVTRAVAAAILARDAPLFEVLP